MVDLDTLLAVGVSGCASTAGEGAALGVVLAAPSLTRTHARTHAHTHTQSRQRPVGTRLYLVCGIHVHACINFRHTATTPVHHPPSPAHRYTPAKAQSSSSAAAGAEEVDLPTSPPALSEVAYFLLFFRMSSWTEDYAHGCG